MKHNHYYNDDVLPSKLFDFEKFLISSQVEILILSILLAFVITSEKKYAMVAAKYNYKGELMNCQKKNLTRQKNDNERERVWKRNCELDKLINFYSQGFVKRNTEM